MEISVCFVKENKILTGTEGEGCNISDNQKGTDKLPRKLTPRECARLQGFPENFIFPVSDTRAYKQFGNSVAVPVIREIAKNMLDTLGKLEKGKNG